MKIDEEIFRQAFAPEGALRDIYLLETIVERREKLFKALAVVCDYLMQPFQGCGCALPKPRVARSEQPWAECFESLQDSFRASHIGRSVCSLESMVAVVRSLFRHLPFAGANDEKVGLLGLVPGVAVAAQPYPELSSFALSGLRTGASNVFHRAHFMLSVLGRNHPTIHSILVLVLLLEKSSTRTTTRRTIHARTVDGFNAACRVLNVFKLFPHG